MTHCQTMLGALLALQIGAAGAAEFHTLSPGSGSLIIDSTAGFNAVNVYTPAKSYNGSGGQFAGRLYQGSASADALVRFFCIELSQWAAIPGPTTYTIGTYANDGLRKLYDVAYPNATASDFWNNGAATNFGQFSGTDGTAFQLAVWELAFDSDRNLGTGSFQAYASGTNATARTRAQAWLDAVAAYSGNGYQDWTLYSMTSPTNQDYLTATWHHAPEPATLGLVAAALGGLGLAGRRRRTAALNSPR